MDELQRNGYGIIQNPARFCFGMDAVLLSGFAKAKAGEKVLDLGTGTGIIPILMEAKTDAADFTAFYTQKRKKAQIWQDAVSRTIISRIRSK